MTDLDTYTISQQSPRDKNHKMLIDSCKTSMTHWTPARRQAVIPADQSDRGKLQQHFRGASVLPRTAGAK